MDHSVPTFKVGKKPFEDGIDGDTSALPLPPTIDDTYVVAKNLAGKKSNVVSFPRTKEQHEGTEGGADLEVPDCRVDATKDTDKELKSNCLEPADVSALRG